MPAAYHHGTETIRVNGGSNPVYTVDGAIVGIVGTAPIGAVNEFTVCLTKKDFAQFGSILHAGFTLPDAFDIIARYQSGTYYVVNVLDPAKHKSRVTDEVITPDPVTLLAKTAKPGLINLTLTAAGTPLNEGSDYVVEQQDGTIRFKAVHSDIKATYDYADPSKVTMDDIKGGYELATGKRTGLELLTEGFNRTGSDAKILIAPGFDADAGVAAELEAMGERLKAFSYVCAPQGTTLSKAIQGRGPLGDINFQSSGQRHRHFYPHAIGTSGKPENLATHAAALRMKVDVDKGYWHSTSNHNLLGVIGSEVPLTARVDDVQSETNRLNAVGITTIFNSFGTGFRLWGNRSACWPMVTHISNFEVVERTGDLIDESIRRFELQYIDRPIDDALIDSLLESVDTYMRGLPSIVGYSVNLDFDYDLVDAFSQGQVPIKYEYTPKIPAERITNTSVITRKFLVNLVSNRAAAASVI